ncbi:MAG TPA: DUF4402 domain-containing protein [Sphingomicrobium sp.]|nr:DUF4402 domain-containing protein [Sphingomicrobium sp.]
MFRQCMMMAALAALATPAAAQVFPDQQATGEALILVPLSLVKIDDLDFGSVITSPVSGTVAINATTGARTVAGGVTGLASDPGFRARFAGAGSPNQQVIVVVTPPAALANANGDLLPVLALTLEGSPIKSIDPVTRAFYFGVGGIILVNADQPEGVYSADFDVTAIYQ